MPKQSPRSPSGKALVMLLMMGAIFTAVVGAGGVVIYLNRDKFGVPSVGNLAAVAEAQRAEVQAQQAAQQGAAPHLSAGAAPAPRSLKASAPIPANQSNYRTWTARQDVLVMVDYYADWCGPCRKISPSLSRLAATHGDKVVVLKVNVDHEKALAAAAGIRSIPDVRLLHSGQQLERIIGGRPYDYYESLVLKHASRLPKPAAAPATRPATQPGAPPAAPGGSITPLKKDWLPPGVKPTRS